MPKYVLYGRMDPQGRAKPKSASIDRKHVAGDPENPAEAVEVVIDEDSRAVSPKTPSTAYLRPGLNIPRNCSL